VLLPGVLSPKPFPALRYSPSRVDLAAVLGPATSDPRHVRRLLDTAEPGHATRAALFVAEWQRAGVLVRDAQPSLTVVRRRSADGDEALGAFAAVSLQDVEPADDELRAQLFDAARVAVEPALVAVVDDSGRMRRTLEGAADREPDATVSLGADTFEAFVVDDETTAARLAALPFASQQILSGADALAAQAAWWQTKVRGAEDMEGRAGAYGLAFFVEEKDGWTRAPIGLVLAPLFGSIDAAS
jgi:Protein of unknown function (DUF1015)